MRAKAARGEATFAVTADVSEAHRQATVHLQDRRLLGCYVRFGSGMVGGPTVHIKPLRSSSAVLCLSLARWSHLYKFLFIHPRFSVCRIPSYVAFIL